MPSFDIVSKVNQHELANAVDQANREVTTRFDFKDSGARFELKSDSILLVAPNEFQLKQMLDVLHGKLAKRDLDIRILELDQSPILSLKEARQEAKIKQGLDAVMAKKIVKLIKDKGLKVQASIQGDEVRVTGKKRDDLQTVIAFLREQELEQPLQYDNFRD